MAKRKTQDHDKRLLIGLPEVDKIMENHDYKNLVPVHRILVPTLHKDDDDSEDRISELPDHILHFIISFLPMREGAATCILSLRWRNLWADSATYLHFTNFNLFGSPFTRKILDVKQNELLNNEPSLRMNRSSQLLHFRRKALQIQRTEFLKRANQILKFRRASTINEFLVSFPLGKMSAPDVDTWMQLAAAQGVTKLDLHFNWYQLSSSYDSTMYYNFHAQQFGSSLNYLRLRFCNIIFPHDFRGLNSLVSLTLNQCFLTNDNVQAIFSNCPSLEILSLKNCFAPKPTILKFVGPSTLLKYLDIVSCRGITEVELQDVNLLSFELKVPDTMCCGPEPPLQIKLSIKNAPHLARLVLQLYTYWLVEGMVEGLVQTLSNVPRLETLFIKHEVSRLSNLSAFNNLKRLVFCAAYDKSNLFEVLCLLQACPLLQKLHVDMGRVSDSEGCELTEQTSKITTRPECPHNNLKEVEMYGFDSHSEQIELAKYLLTNAMVLEKMKISTTCKTYFGQGAWTFPKRTKNPLLMSLDEVRKLLLKEKRDYTKLLIE